MADGRDHRRPACKNRPCHHLFIKSPEILDGTAAAAHNQDVKPHGIQGFDALCDAVFRLRPLDKRRVQHKLDVRVPPFADVYDIPDGSAGGRCDDADFRGVPGNVLLIFGRKRPHFLQLVSQLFKPQKQIAAAGKLDFRRVKLVLPVTLIDVHVSLYNYLLAFRETEGEASSLACKHHGRQGAASVL